MNWVIALPEIVLAVSGLLILSVGVLTKKGHAFLPSATLSIAAFVVTGFFVATSQGGVGYDGLFVVDAFARFIKLLAIVGGVVAIALSVGYTNEHRELPFEMPILVLFSTLGAMVMASSANLMTLFVGLELSSLAIYVLCAMERDRLGSAEAGLKYFILGSLASGLLLYGVSLVYGYAGTMEYAPIAAEINSAGILPIGLVIGMVFVLVGLAFKLSAGAIPHVDAGCLSGRANTGDSLHGRCAKVCSFRSDPARDGRSIWCDVAALAVADRSDRGSVHAVRFLRRYSPAQHQASDGLFFDRPYGLRDDGLAAASPAGTTGTLVYLTTYLIMNAGTFGVITAMRRKGREVTEISDIAGLGRTNPGLALVLAICMFSMIGVPPLAGFFGKFMVFAAAWNAGLYPLIAIGVVSAVVGAFYYLRIVKVAYFDPAAPAFDRPAPSVSFVSIAMGLATVLFLIGLGPISEAAQAAAQALIG